MGVKGWNIAVLVAIGAIWFCGTTQREKPVVGDSSSSSGRGRVGALETRAAAYPTDTTALRELAQAYLDVHQPGLAVGAIERAAPAVRTEPTVEHLYARALLDQGRSADALAAEKRVLAACADPSIQTPCSTWLIASATRRAEIVDQLVQLGVEDANAHPEASSLAYHNATRQVSLAVYAR
ncbi:MAG TPA: hypothetical protein VM925_01225 [Labilithrix sp.]|nr:hypothetical protein [Labilithrix sp.]